jgi:hypothetical protein
MGFFFVMVHRIIDRMWAVSGADPIVANSFLALVDLIVRKVRMIEYGRLSSVFPQNLINDAYLYLDAVHDDTRGKGKKKKRINK